MGESGLHLPPLLRNAEIASKNDYVIARLEVLVPFRVELVEVGKECEEIINNRVDTAIDAPVWESFDNVILEVIRQERFENIHVSPGVVQLSDESDLRRIRHPKPPQVDVDGPLEIICLLLAQSGHHAVEFQCLLLGVKRTSVAPSSMSAFDPKRTCGGPLGSN